MQTQMAVLHILAVLNVLSANVRLALRACSTMLKWVEHKRLNKLRGDS
jgi:hypothetical protein